MARKQCPVGVKFVARGCGYHPVILIGCNSPLCPKCEKQRTKRNLRKWAPVLKAFKSPRMVTLTITSGHDLAGRITAFSEAFRRLLDTRMGARARAQLLVECEAYIAQMQTSDEKRIHHRDSIKRFMREVERLEEAYAAGWRDRAPLVIEGLPHSTPVPDDSQFKFRHCIGKGLSTLEITYNATEGWHVHRHIALDGSMYIPQVLLTVLWLDATRNAGRIVDIRALRGARWAREVVKYVSKMWEIPDDKADELEFSVKGLKRIWPLGRLKPVQEAEACRSCGSLTCRCEHVASASNADRLPGTTDYLADVSLVPTIFTVYQDDSDKKLGLLWDAQRVKPETAEWLRQQLVIDARTGHDDVEALRHLNASLYLEKAMDAPHPAPIERFKVMQT